MVFYPEADSLKDPMFWLALSFWQTDMILSMFSGSALLAAEISFMAVYSTQRGPGAGRQAKLEGSFSAVSMPNFAIEASFESSRQDKQKTHHSTDLRPQYSIENG